MLGKSTTFPSEPAHPKIMATASTAAQQLQQAEEATANAPQAKAVAFAAKQVSKASPQPFNRLGNANNGTNVIVHPALLHCPKVTNSTKVSPFAAMFPEGAQIGGCRGG